MQSISVFLDTTKYADFRWKKCRFQQNSGGVPRDSYIFLIFFRSGITVPSFIIVGYVLQILERVGLFGLPPSLSSLENARPE